MNNTHTTEKAESASAEDRAQFTPGPWRIELTSKGGRSIYGRSVDCFDGTPLPGNETYICDVRKGHWIYEQDANARLIAAAPDLLEACNQARIWLGNHGNDDAAAEVHDFICAAMGKAEGWQP